MRFPSLPRSLAALVCLTTLTVFTFAQQNWRWVNMKPASVGFNRVAYGNGLYVAVGTDATIVTSPDAITWTVRRMSAANQVLNGVAFGDGRFVAVGMGIPTAAGAGLILTSTDGITWTRNDTIASTVNAQFSDVVYGNGTWIVSGAAQNTVYTSADGLAWTARSLGSTGYFTGKIAFGGGKFFVLSNNNAGHVSADGITWTNSTISATTSAYFQSIAYGNNQFVAVGQGSDFNPLIATSTDGATWTPGSLSSGGTGGFSWVSFANDVFVAAGNGGLYSSPDGSTWTARTSAMPPTRKSTPGSVGTENIGGVAAANDTLFVFGIYGSITTSSDGAAWTRQSTGTAHDINGLVDDGTRLVGVGTGGTVVTSTDGETWEASSTNVTGWLGQLAYGNGHYVTAGISGGYHSSDLATWTAIPGTSFNQMFGVIYANGLFVAANNALSLGLPTSSDGATWTTKTVTGGSGTVTGLAGGGGTFVVTTGGFGGTPKIYSSADATTWTDSTPANLTAPNSLAYGNGLYVLVTSTDSWTSPDGATWTSHPFASGAQVTGVMFVGTNFVGRATKDNNTVIFKASADGVTWTEIPDSTPPNAVFTAMVARGDKVYASGGGGAILEGDLAGTSTPDVPPESQTVSAGGDASFTTSTTGSLQWLHDGVVLAGKTSATLSLTNVQPADTGVYSVRIANGDSVTVQSAILGILTSEKVVGSGEVVGSDIHHPNGNIFDQVLLTGAAETITADPGQITRTSYIDLDDDIVQVEFSGAGSLSLVLEDATGPALPVNYNQSVTYMKGHAHIVIVGADETTNVSVFSVGKANAVNQALFKDDVEYDGIADIASIAISSTNGKFAGLRAANANFFASAGLAGVYAPGVEFSGPVYIGNIIAFDNAIPAIVLGSAAVTKITGGDMLQGYDVAVQVSGIDVLQFVDGTTSHGVLLAAQPNQARFEEDGVDVTDIIVDAPAPPVDDSGLTVELTYFASGSNPPYTNGAKKTFIVSTTSLKFDSTTLTNPTTETLNAPYTGYLFTDTSTNLVWEVIFNGDALHEINITRNGNFVGQWSE